MDIWVEIFDIFNFIELVILNVPHDVFFSQGPTYGLKNDVSTFILDFGGIFIDLVICLESYTTWHRWLSMQGWSYKGSTCSSQRAHKQSNILDQMGKKIACWSANLCPIVREILFFFRSSQQLLHLRLIPLKGFLSWHSFRQRCSTCILNCFRNHRDTRTPSCVPP